MSKSRVCLACLSIIEEKEFYSLVKVENDSRIVTGHLHNECYKMLIR